MTDFKLAIACCALLLGGSAGAAPAEDGGPAQVGAGCMADCGPAGDPVVYPGEVVAAASEWDDAEPWGGNPPPWFEDPASVNCEVADKWCESEEYQQAVNESAVKSA